jgi:hypothetical protein
MTQSPKDAPPRSFGGKLYHCGSLTYTTGALGRLYFWLLAGDFTYFMVESVVPSAIPLKLKSLHASNLFMGLIITTIPRIIGGIFNPVISVRSDRFRSRWGRRIPFIAATVPPLVLCFFGMGYVDAIGPWLGRVAPAFAQHHSQEFLVLIVLSVLLVGFDFFNTFVTSVFWYLFNDVVPPEIISRFVSYFRMVIMVTGILYNKFITPYVESHFREIFVGAGIFYFAGFGLMCLFVREGEYPPPLENTDGGTGFISTLKTYGAECMSLRHYWYLYLWGIFGALAGACGVFMIFFQRYTMGITQLDVGNLGVIGAVTALVCVPVCGWLGDKFHPLRILLWGNVLALFVVPIDFIWVWWRPGPQVYFWFTALKTMFIACPIGMMCQMDVPMLMRILPKERYGQFCSCRVLLTNLATIVTGGAAGAYLDYLTVHYGEKTAYACIPFWQFTFSLMTVYFLLRLFRSWKAYGGDASYVPPIPAHSRAEVLAHSDPPVPTGD